jgi:hypothetical protein
MQDRWIWSATGQCVPTGTGGRPTHTVRSARRRDFIPEEEGYGHWLV